MKGRKKRLKAKTKTKINAKTKVLTLLVVLVMLMSLFTACGQTTGQEPSSKDTGGSKDTTSSGNDSQGTSSSELPTIRYRHWYTEADPSNKKIYDFIQQWADKNKDKINLVQEISIGDESKVTLYIDISSGTVPDAFNMWGNPVTAIPIVDSDTIIDIGEYCAVGANKLEDYDQGTLNRTRIKGVQTVIPLEGWSSYWFANKELFDKYNLEIPKTWDELMEVGRVFKENGIITFSMGSKLGTPTYEVFAEFYNQLPGAVEDLQNLSKFQLNDANWQILLKRMAEMRDAGLWPEDTVGAGDWGAYLALFNQGKAAILQGYTWMLKDFNPDMVDKTVKISPIKMPECVLDVDNYQRSGCDYGMMINKDSWNDSAKRDQLIALADFIGSEEFLVNKFYANGEVPPRNTYTVDWSRMSVPMMDVVIKDKLENRPIGGENFMWFPGGNVRNALNDAFDGFTAGTKTADEVISMLKEALEEAKEEAGGKAIAEYDEGVQNN